MFGPVDLTVMVSGLLGIWVSWLETLVSKIYFSGELTALWSDIWTNVTDGLGELLQAWKQ